ncbi:MAG: hypothetical protein ABIJ18_00860 [archaeon]
MAKQKEKQDGEKPGSLEQLLQRTMKRDIEVPQTLYRTLNMTLGVFGDSNEITEEAGLKKYYDNLTDIVVDFALGTRGYGKDYRKSASALVKKFYENPESFANDDNLEMVEDTFEKVADVLGMDIASDRMRSLAKKKLSVSDVESKVGKAKEALPQYLNKDMQRRLNLISDAEEFLAEANKLGKPAALSYKKEQVVSGQERLGAFMQLYSQYMQREELKKKYL